MVSAIAEREPTSGARISTRHNGIPGRARLQVTGLRGNEALKDLLETAAVDNGIRSISASSVTGNALVFYDPAKELPEIVGYLEIVIQLPAPPRARPQRDSQPGASQ